MAYSTNKLKRNVCAQHFHVCEISSDFNLWLCKGHWYFEKHWNFINCRFYLCDKSQCTVWSMAGGKKQNKNGTAPATICSVEA